MAFDAGKEEFLYLKADAEPVSLQFRQKMDTLVAEYTQVNNLILESDYYEE